jgi:hypothetical protein
MVRMRRYRIYIVPQGDTVKEFYWVDAPSKTLAILNFRAEIGNWGKPILKVTGGRAIDSRK